MRNKMEKWGRGKTDQPTIRSIEVEGWNLFICPKRTEGGKYGGLRFLPTEDYGIFVHWRGFCYFVLILPDALHSLKDIHDISGFRTLYRRTSVNSQYSQE